jgi:hypothetical protein
MNEPASIFVVLETIVYAIARCGVNDDFVKLVWNCLSVTAAFSDLRNSWGVTHDVWRFVITLEDCGFQGNVIQFASHFERQSSQLRIIRRQFMIISTSYLRVHMSHSIGDNAEFEWYVKIMAHFTQLDPVWSYLMSPICFRVAERAEPDRNSLQMIIVRDSVIFHCFCDRLQSLRFFLSYLYSNIEFISEARPNHHQYLKCSCPISS